MPSSLSDRGSPTLITQDSAECSCRAAPSRASACASGLPAAAAAAASAPPSASAKPGDNVHHRYSAHPQLIDR
jgi:hypothetical protein